MDILLFIILGASVGILSGYFGIGGGFVLTPILLLMGYSPTVAIATSLLYTIGTSLSGVIAHVRMKNIHIKKGIVIACSGLLATQIAYPFIKTLEKYEVEHIIIPLFYILLAGYFSFSMLKGKKEVTTEAGNKNNLWIILLVIGFIGGFISTTLGVGGGFIIVPLSITFLGLPPKKAVGTSLFAVFFIVIAGFISYSFSTAVDYSFAFTLIIGAMLGGQIGAYVTRLYKNDEIKKLLGGLYVITVINMILKLIGFTEIGLIISLSYIALLLTIFSGRIWKYFRNRNVQGERI